MISLFKVYKRGLEIALKTRIAYRFDFFVSILIIIFFDLLPPLLMVFIYSHGISFPGWSLYEIILLQSILMIAQGITFPLVFGIIWRSLDLLVEGTFDLLLIKPLPILFTLLVSAIDIEDLGNLVCGFMLFFMALHHLPSPTLMQWGLFGGVFIISLLVLSSIALCMSASLFIWQGNSRVTEIYNILYAFLSYPFSIYSKGLKVILTYIIPISVITYVPSSILLGKDPASVVLICIISVSFFILSLIVWHVMIRKYSSAGG